MAIPAVSQKFYTKTECTAITAIAYCGMALLLIGIISQCHLDIFAKTHMSHINAVTCTSVGATIICVEILVLLVKKNSDKVKQTLNRYMVMPAKEKALQAYHVVDAICTDAGNTFHKNIGSHLFEAATLTSDYVKENYKTLFLYLLAWVAVCVGFGLLHGFKGTALPLAIGISGGFALGIAVGIITVKSAPFRPQDVTTAVLEEKGAQIHIDKRNLWGLTTIWFNELDADGTKMIIQTVLITIFMTFTPIFPVPAGGLIGAICGNALALQIAYNKFAKKWQGPNKIQKQAAAVEEYRRKSVAQRGGAEFKA